MIELLLVIPAVWAIVARARKRAVDETWFAVVPLVVWIVSFALQATGMAPPIVALIARWGTVACSWIAVELATPSTSLMEWQCPECRAFNEPGALTCVCRRVRPDLRGKRNTRSDNKSASGKPDEGSINQARREVLSIVQSMIGERINEIEGCRAVVMRASEAAMHDDPDMRTFIAIASETDDLPVGKQRELWNAAALVELDRKRAEYMAQVRASLRAACLSIEAKLKTDSGV